VSLYLILPPYSSIEPMLCYAMLCYAMLCYAMLCYAMLRRSANVWYLGAASVRLVARTTAVDVEVFDFRDYASVQLRAGGFGEGGVVGGGLGMGDVGFVEMRWGSGFYSCLVD